MAFKPVTMARSFEIISEQIRARIEAQRLRPGDKLPPERELSQQFGVSRNAVREALRGLESAGIIELRKGAHGGAFVCEGRPDQVVQSFKDMFTLGSISINDLTEARQEIMNLILENAARRATDDDLKRLERNIDLTEAALLAGRDDEQMERTGEFYRMLAEATQNPVLVLVISPLYEIVRRFVAAAGIRATSEVITARRAILASLREGDAAAARQLMSVHLRAVHSAILRRYPEGVIPTEKQD